MDSSYYVEFDGADWDTYTFQFYVPHGTEGVKIVSMVPRVPR